MRGVERSDSSPTSPRRVRVEALSIDNVVQGDEEVYRVWDLRTRQRH
jgi:hypothetical protein